MGKPISREASIDIKHRSKQTYTCIYGNDPNPFNVCLGVWMWVQIRTHVQRSFWTQIELILVSLEISRCLVSINIKKL